MSEHMYEGLTVVEIASTPGAEQTGKLLADQGATVIKVEPPQGAASRGVGPFAKGVEGPDTSLHFWTYNTSKKSVVLADDAEGRRRRAELIADCDILITDAGPAGLAEAGLDLSALVDQHARLIALSISPFGLTGPWADYASSDLVALAAGGLLNSCGYDDHSIPPIRPGGNQGYQTAAAFAHAGVLLALLERQATGRGQLVDVSMHEAIAVSGELANPYWFYPKSLVKRQTCRHAQPSPTQPSLYQCGDGKYVYFTFIVSDQRTWTTLVGWMDEYGIAADLTDPAYLELPHRQENFHHIQNLLECFFLLLDAETAYTQGQDRGLPLGPLRAPEEMFQDEHLRSRGFFVDVTVPTGQTVEFVNSPITYSTTAPRVTAPPALGQHTAEVLDADA